MNGTDRSSRRQASMDQGPSVKELSAVLGDSYRGYVLSPSVSCRETGPRCSLGHHVTPGKTANRKFFVAVPQWMVCPLTRHRLKLMTSVVVGKVISEIMPKDGLDGADVCYGKAG